MLCIVCPASVRVLSTTFGTTISHSCVDGLPACRGAEYSRRVGHRSITWGYASSGVRALCSFSRSSKQDAGSILRREVLLLEGIMAERLLTEANVSVARKLLQCPSPECSRLITMPSNCHTQQKCCSLGPHFAVGHQKDNEQSPTGKGILCRYAHEQARVPRCPKLLPGETHAQRGMSSGYDCHTPRSQIQQDAAHKWEGTGCTDKQNCCESIPEASLAATRSLTRRAEETLWY